MDTLLTNCIVATLCDNGNKFGILPGDDNCIGLLNGIIVYVGPLSTLQSSSEHPLATDFIAMTSAAMLSQRDPLYSQSIINLQGNIVTPGLIDCHTHVVYGGNRCDEWELKLRGASYEEVAQAGGGIVNTVEGTRSATVEELVNTAKPRIEAMLREGTTCIEIKSGYGLNLNAERNMLLAAKKLSEIYPIDVVTTFLGAHAVPKEFKSKMMMMRDEMR